MSNIEYPTEIITLPSGGKCYPPDNPLASGTIEIKYMTAKEEEILTSQNLIRKGVVLDKLFESIVVDPKVNLNDIILGDKNAIMLATRVLGYGADYIIENQNEEGEQEKLTVDLTKIQIKEVDESKLSIDNKYTFVTPNGKNTIVFKLLTHGDEQSIDAEVKALTRLNKQGTSPELTTRYRHMILSVDGKEDVKDITSFIKNQFRTLDTKAFRKHLKEFQPDVVMEYEYINSLTGNSEVRPIPMGVGFFWPTD